MQAKPDISILMVDDEPANLLALEGILAPLGQRLIRAQSGNEALRHLLDTDFAVILLDVRMPGMSGIEAAALIRSRPRSRSTPIIFLTGEEKSADAMFEGYSAGAVDYLMKPVVPAILRSKVEVFTELAQARLRLQQQIQERERVAEELSRLNAMLAQRNGDLAAANLELDSFCATVAHDLRSPLSQIIGFTQLLEMSCASKLGKDELQRLNLVRTIGLQMNDMVTDFLNFARLGSTPIQAEPVNMADMASTIAAELSAPGRGAPAEWTVGALPLARGDSRMLRQVWINLLSNALKYSKNSHPIRIQVQGELQGDELIYSVTDNGVGFDTSQAPRLFAAFSRLHGQDEFEGIGIGLSSVKRIIQKHGGRVWAQAEVGHGATFCFSLPASPQAFC
ncbi:ATP-binding protein [Aquabacterium sp. CECT 9606]|uniref:sensor histidine kinase n=1 Tax=Aquabacterium sp. CECT 9606 TaxID=2845822 RepID=UPI001E4DBF50|nr:ATP-binding protein [Aquabacterium sp. CECT 9606]CAH0349046.1 Adaptive-response sensory-kinase SasA [Aquabacterium sp. CECT 9606]